MSGTIRIVARDVVSLVPRRSSSTVSQAELFARLGNGAFERSNGVFDESGRRSRRHLGWRWQCDCSAFARADGNYVWIPCARHDEHADHRRRALESGKTAQEAAHAHPHAHAGGVFHTHEHRHSDPEHAHEHEASSAEYARSDSQVHDRPDDRTPGRE
ncbi:MAG TPA: hypothetical protein VHT05_05780 [Candidatus Elarobacter sp.]|jgi:hypothetical protein|nr:hypothetical protein [Candidatus Elarobacter sp.]